jgi:hypothetical protein
MGHTSEERNTLATPLCGAKKKNGERCRAFAGQGTDHPGFGTCKYHGGATPSAGKHAIKLQAKAEMIRLGGPVDVQPTEALLALLRASAGHVSWLLQEIQELTDLGTEQAKVLLSMYDSERDRAARTAEACVRAGVAEKHLQLEQARIALLVDQVRGAAKEAGLSSKQTQALGAAMRKMAAEISPMDDPDAKLAQIEAADKNLAKIRAEIEEADQKRIEQAAAKRPPADLVYPPDEWLPEEPTPA